MGELENGFAFSTNDVIDSFVAGLVRRDFPYYRANEIGHGLRISLADRVAKDNYPHLILVAARPVVAGRERVLIQTSPFDENALEFVGRMQQKVGKGVDIDLIDELTIGSVASLDEMRESAHIWGADQIAVFHMFKRLESQRDILERLVA